MDSYASVKMAFFSFCEIVVGHHIIIYLNKVSGVWAFAFLGDLQAELPMPSASNRLKLTEKELVHITLPYKNQDS